MIAVVIVVIVVLVPIIVSRFLEFLRHWWESNALWQVGKGIDEASPLIIAVIEGAAFSELAFTGLLPEFAGSRLVI